jgi:hypothetical protein
VDGYKINLYVDGYRNRNLTQKVELSAAVSDSQDAVCVGTFSLEVDAEYVGDYMVMELVRESDGAREYIEIDQLPAVGSSVSSRCVGNFIFANPPTIYTLQAFIRPVAKSESVYPHNLRYNGIQVMDLDETKDPSLLSEGESVTPEHHIWATDQGRVEDGTYIIYVRDNGEDGTGLRVRLQGAGLAGIDSGRFDLIETAADKIDVQPLYFIQVKNHAVVRMETIPIGAKLIETITGLPSDQGGFGFEQPQHLFRQLYRAKSNMVGGQEKNQ